MRTIAFLCTISVVLVLFGGAGSPFMAPIYTTPGELDMLTVHGHPQGAACSERAIYVSCSRGIVKLDWSGHVVKTCEVRAHLGDIAYAKGRIYGVYGLWDRSANESPLMAGIWDEDLNPIMERHYNYPHARGFDSCVVLGDTLYMSVDHYWDGKGRFHHPPHRDNTILMASSSDLSPKGYRDIEFDYPIHFSAQTLGTDGENLLFGNYGASRNEGNEKGFNFSRATKDFRLLDSHKFTAYEGFALVPKSVSGREDTVFFNINSLGCNMQGWWRDPKGNPARIRFDFFSYDKKTGEMKNITDTSRGGGVPETVFIEEQKPLSLDAEAWKAGGGDWSWAEFSMPEIYRDVRGYDRIAIDYVNETEGNAATPLQCYVSGPEGHVNRGLLAKGGAIPSCGYGRWEFPIGEWNRFNGVDPSNITRMQFFVYRPRIALKLRIYRITLLPKGSECPPPAESFRQKVLEPLERGKRERENAQEKGRAIRWAASAAAFRAECAAAGQRGAFCVGVASSMEKIRPLDGNFPAVAKLPTLRLARGERESIQFFILPARGSLKNVMVELGELRKGNDVIPSKNASVSVVGYVNITNYPPYMVGKNVSTTNAPGYVRRAVPCPRGWWPDPLLTHVKCVDVQEDNLQGFWIRIHAPDTQAKGIYRGELTICADGTRPMKMPFCVQVNGFAVPKTPMLPLAVSFGPWAHAWGDRMKVAPKLYGDPTAPLNLWKKHKDVWCDFLADHYLSFDNLYDKCPNIPNFDMLERQSKIGMRGRFNLGYWPVPEQGDKCWDEWCKRHLNPLKAAYERAKNLGVLDRAYVYGCDEANPDTFERIRRAVAEIRRELPGVPIVTTARDVCYGVNSPLSDIDWFAPVTEEFDCAKAEIARAAGHQVWWYFACDQNAPCANSFIEGQGIEMRSVMGAQSVKFRPDGFLYYSTAIWNSSRPIGTEPFTDWEPRSWKDWHGCGNWICCGPDGLPVSTIRLENFCDGLEDYAYAMILERKLKERKEKDDAWSQKAKELLAVPRGVVDTITNYTDAPAVLYRWRDAMADLIEAAEHIGQVDAAK